MFTRLPPSELDEILALQLSVAWAGESAGEPARWGYWATDLVDPEGGGDLFVRLVPRTAPWASLALVREAARRVDEAARRPIDAEDRLVTLFHLGFAVDEQLDDRLAFHRQHGHVPREVLGERFLVGTSAGSVETMLASLGAPKVAIVPGGRKVAPDGGAPVDRARALAAALLPLESRYPLPYVEPSA